MTILVLTKQWINLMSTGEGISGATGRGKVSTQSVGGEMRTYASGRRRAISVVGEVRAVPFVFMALDLPTKIKLESWAGQPVQVRDIRSQKWYGTFFGVTSTEYMRTDLYQCALQLEVSTFVEGN